MKWLLCVSTVCCSCPEKNHTFDHACRFPIVWVSPFSPYSCLSNHHWKGKKCPLVSLDSAANAVLPLEVQTVHRLLLESKVVAFWMAEMIVCDRYVWSDVLRDQKTLDSVPLLEREENVRIFIMGVGVQTPRKELGVVVLSGWDVPVLGEAFAGKGEWHECLDLSVRIACVCMKQGETSSTKPREESRWASYRIELLRIGGYYIET